MEKSKAVKAILATAASQKKTRRIRRKFDLRGSKPEENNKEFKSFTTTIHKEQIYKLKLIAAKHNITIKEVLFKFLDKCIAEYECREEELQSPNANFDEIIK